MAFSGFHVSIHDATRSTKDGAASMQIYGELVSSETLTTAGTTTLAVPSDSKYFARITVSDPSWITIGATPADPSDAANTRIYNDSSYPTDILVAPSVKFRWSAA